MQPDSSRQWSLSISKSAGYVFLGLIFLSIVVFGAASYNAWKRNSDLQQMSKMREENQLLREKMANFSIQMDSLLIKIRIMEAWEDQLREERSLKLISPDVRALGSGGLPMIDTSFLLYDDYLHSIYNDNLQKMDFLQAKIKLTYETHLDLKLSLQKRENLYKSTPSIWPTFGRITDQFGLRTHPLLRYKTMHTGVDIANDRGTLIYATADGTVVFSERSGASGNLIRINHASGYQTRYAHLDSSLVRGGDFVTKGQIIALMGNSGSSTGNHLHYEVLDLRSGNILNPNHFFSLTEEQIVLR
jgi:murein DD-endopeptidase MepM/ murein hydrolase activator NlpD